MRLRISLVTVLLCGVVACAQLAEADKSREDAKRSGKYKVRLTEDAELVQGTCKFIRTIVPSMDPVQAPTKADLDEYYQIEAVLLGADTVLVTGRTSGTYRTAEAYLCGPTPLNPDGTTSGAYRPAPTPHK